MAMLDDYYDYLMTSFTFTRVSSKKNTDTDYLRGLGNLTKQ